MLSFNCVPINVVQSSFNDIVNVDSYITIAAFMSALKPVQIMRQPLILPQSWAPYKARFDLTRGPINSAPRFYKILLCLI